MKINKKFNQMSIAEYRHYIAHHQKYADFNPLGLYRSILENPKLNEAAQLEVLALANRHFQRFYDFLFAKDLFTYSRLATLGQGLSETALRQHLRDTWDRRKKWWPPKEYVCNASASVPPRNIILLMPTKPQAIALSGT